MKTFSFLFFLYFGMTISSMAQKEIEAHVRLYKVAVEGDTTSFNKKLIKIKFSTVSDLVKIGSSEERSYFIKLELLQSNIDEDPSYIVVSKLYEKINKDSDPVSFHTGFGKSYIAGPEDDIDLGLTREKGNNSISMTKDGEGVNNESFYFQYDLRFQWLD